MKKNGVTLVAGCLDFQEVQEKCKYIGGLLQLILIPECKQDVISMDFIIGLSRKSKQHDSVMVVVDRLTKLTHFIPLKSINLACEVAQLFMSVIVSLHGIPKKIV